jgi:hypothetical protein
LLNAAAAARVSRARGSPPAKGRAASDAARFLGEHQERRLKGVFGVMHAGQEPPAQPEDQASPPRQALDAISARNLSAPARRYLRIAAVASMK